MDWEKKFNSIIKDTDASLLRVKNKFQSPATNNVTWAPKLYSTPMKRSTSLADLELASSSALFSTQKPPGGFNQSFTGGDLYGGMMSASVPGPSSSSYMPFQSIQILQEKLEQQNTALEHLRGLIHRLETDRANYKEQVRDLRNEVYQLTEKSGNHRPDPSVERRIETMRREFLGEIQLLQSQIQINTAKGRGSNMSDTQLMSLNRDMLEMIVADTLIYGTPEANRVDPDETAPTGAVSSGSTLFANTSNHVTMRKHAYRDELEGLRRDIEILRSRVSRVELELTSTLSNRRESPHDRSPSSVNQLQQTSQQMQQQSALAAINANRHFDRMQINDLRAALGNLQNKIDILESSSPHVATTKHTTSLPPKMTKLFSEGHQTKKSLENGLLDDLDLSDDDDTQSSDFTEFETMSSTKKRKDDIELNQVDDDELDLDDLDLSDDDLSDNSLGTPIS